SLCAARSSRASEMVSPSALTVPLRWVVVSQNGGVTANLIGPDDERILNSADDGTNGPPSGPEIVTPDAGVVIREGLLEGSAMAITGIAKNPMRATILNVMLCYVS